MIAPNLLLKSADRDQLRTVFIHELLHVKRADVLLDCIFGILQIVNFFNPLIWLASRFISLAREEAIDEAVLAGLGEKAAIYPQALLDIAKYATKVNPSSLPSAAIFQRTSMLGERIRRMMSHPFPKTAKLGFLGFLLTLLCGVYLLPMGRRPIEEYHSWIERPHLNEVRAIRGEAKFARYSLRQVFDDFEFGKQPDKKQALAVEGFRNAGLKSVPFLAAHLDPTTSPESDRRKAAWLLGQLGPSARNALPELMRTVTLGGSPAIYAAQALGAIGPAAKPAVPILYQALRVGNDFAARALVGIAPHDPDLVPELINAVVSGEGFAGGQRRIAATMALSALGDQAAAAIPALMKLLSDGDRVHRFVRRKL